MDDRIVTIALAEQERTFARGRRNVIRIPASFGGIKQLVGLQAGQRDRRGRPLLVTREKDRVFALDLRQFGQEHGDLSRRIAELRPALAPQPEIGVCDVVE